jgi:hypothetical protein
MVLQYILWIQHLYFLFPDLCDDSIRETPGCVESDNIEGEEMCYSVQEQ